MTAGVLLERDEVRAAIGEVLAAARAGAGGAVFIVGEPGLGKTSLLDEARVQAGGDMHVGVARGNEMEANLPFGILTQALEGLEGYRVDLPGAVLDPFAELSSPHFRVFRWLQNRSGPPLVLALDDLHWADVDSLSVLAFLVRRMGGLAVALIGTLRPWPSTADDICGELVERGYAARQRLEPLTRPSAAALLARRARLAVTASTQRRAWALCRGNPLLVEQVAMALDRHEEIPDLGADSGALAEHILLSRFAGLDRTSMVVARAASVSGMTFRPELAGEVARLTEDEVDRALDALSRSGLTIDVGESNVRFTHPLFAQAVYDDMAPAVRRRLHARYFHLLADRGLDQEACPHATRADLIGDERAVAVLTRSGLAAFGAGAVTVAARALETAVRFAGDRAAPELLLSLCEALSASGRMEDAATTCGRLLKDPDLDWQHRVSGLRALGRAYYFTGAADHGEAALDRAVTIAVENDPVCAVQPLLDQSLSAWLAGGPSRALPLAARARELARQGDGVLRQRADATWGHLALESGDPAGLEYTDCVRSSLEQTPGAEALDPGDLTWPWASVYQFAMNENYAGRYQQSQDAFERARDALERAGAANAAATVSIHIANLAIRRGRLGEALDEAVRAEEFADLTPAVLPYAYLVRAEALAWMGHFEESTTYCTRGRESAPGHWFAELWMSHILGLNMLWQGDASASDMFLKTETITRAVGIDEPCHVQWAAHAVAAHLAAERKADAVRVVGWLEERATRLPCRWPAIAAALGSARVSWDDGDDEAAEARFRAALGLLDDGELPLFRVEALLALGSFLRRRGRAVEARPMFAQALTLAEACRARSLAETAHAELKLAGGRRRRGPEDRHRLTDAELRVARQAADGHSNAVIATRLHLSGNTIESHLKHVYAKLGLTSRRQLMTLDLDDVSAAVAGAADPSA